MRAGTSESEDALLGLLDDQHARAILYVTREEARSAEAIAEEIGVSEATVYRRLERLEEHDLVDVAKQPDPDGHHYSVYAARLQRVEVELTEDGFEVEIDRREPETAADRFTELYEEFAG